jgi:hypothetical protein
MMNEMSLRIEMIHLTDERLTLITQRGLTQSSNDITSIVLGIHGIVMFLNYSTHDLALFTGQYPGIIIV